MPSTPKPVERVMLETVAFFDPIDYHQLKRLVGERLNGEYNTARHREALSNLRQLNMIQTPGLSHEYVHVTNTGWSHLGGDAPARRRIESVDAPVCPVCAEDELVESQW